MRKLIAAIALIIMGTGCAKPLLHMNVKAYADPYQSLTANKTFATIPVGLCQENALLEKQMLYLVRQRLEAKGLVYDEARPDLLIGITCYTGSFEQYVPPRTVYWSMPTSSTTRSMTTGQVGMTSVYGTSTSTTTGTRSVPITRPGYTLTQYYRHISVMFVRVMPSSDGPKIEQVWSGDVDSSGSNSDILVVAPFLLDELLNEYPARSGKPTSRTVPLDQPKARK